MDRRQKKTRKAIYHSFEELMATKHYSAVTVAEIIERADIGRSTFYAHFETKDELLDEMCKEMFTHIFEGVNEHCVTHINLEASGLDGVLAHLLYHLRDTHAGICGKLITEGEPHFLTYFSQQLSIFFQRKVAQTPSMVDRDLYVSMLVASFAQAITWWFESSCDETPEKLAADFLICWHLPA